MKSYSEKYDISFSPADWVADRNKPGKPGQYTGNHRKVGLRLMLELVHSKQESDNVYCLPYI